MMHEINFDEVEGTLIVAFQPVAVDSGLSNAPSELAIATALLLTRIIDGLHGPPLLIGLEMLSFKSPYPALPGQV